MADAALIDLGVIHRLAAELFETVTGVAIVHLGEAEPTGQSVWARMAGITFASEARHRGDDEPDTGDVQIVFWVVTTPEQAGSYAIGTAATRVRLAFEGVTRYEPTTSGGADWVHRLEVLRTDVVIEFDPSSERRDRIATVTVWGRAERRSGRSIESH